jgi:hypothetical protein
MEGGWSLKRLHKLILTSTAYRQASSIADYGLRIADSKANPQSAIRNPQSVDPENKLFWRMTLRRLEAEAIRDSVLAVSGKLNAKPFGTPVPVMVDDVGQFVIGIDNTDGAGRPSGKITPLHGEEFRRSVYVQARRSRPLAVLDTFDAPMMEPNCEARTASTVTPQALMLMNSAFIVEQAAHFAERVRKEAGDDARGQVVHAWRLACAVEPTAEEVAEATTFLGEQPLTSFCHALLSSNRFLYVD